MLKNTQLLVGLLGISMGGNLVPSSFLRDPVKNFKEIISNTGQVSKEEIQLAKQVAALEKSKDNDQEREECWALTEVLADSNFNERPGAFEIFDSILKSPVISFLRLDHGFDIVATLLTMIDKPAGPGVDAIAALLKIIVEKSSDTFINRKSKNEERPLDMLLARAQERSKTGGGKALFDVLLFYFQKHGDLSGHCTKVLEHLAKGPINNQVVSFAAELAKKYVDMSVVPEGKLKEGIKKIASEWFLWTVEKAMTELEDLVRTNGNMKDIKEHAQKVAKFSRKSVEASKDFKSLSRRTLLILANPKFLKRSGAEEVVKILVWGHTLEDVNEKVLVDGEYRQLLPTYISSVVQQPGGETEEKVENITFLINSAADTSAAIEDGGEKIPIFTYLAKKAVENPKAFEMPLSRNIFWLSPTFELWRKKEGFKDVKPAQPKILSSILKVVAKEIEKNPDAADNDQLVSLGAEIIDFGADHRYLPSGKYRDKVREKLEDPKSNIYSRRDFGKTDISIPVQPTTKNTVQETIQEIQKNIKNKNVKEAQKYAEDLQFFDEKAVGSQGVQIDKMLTELFLSKDFLEAVPEAPTIVEQVIQNGVVASPIELANNIKKEAEKRDPSFAPLKKIAEKAKKDFLKAVPEAPTIKEAEKGDLSFAPPKKIGEEAKKDFLKAVPEAPTIKEAEKGDLSFAPLKKIAEKAKIVGEKQKKRVLKTVASPQDDQALAALATALKALEKEIKK